MVFVVLLLFLISLIECAFNRKPLFDPKKDNEKKPKYSQIHFTNEQRVEQFVKTISAFEAFNLKQKYELGRTIAHIIHNMKMEKAGGSVKKSKKKYEEEAAAEPDVIDYNPEESWRTAEKYIKAYKDKPEPEVEESDGQDSKESKGNNESKENREFEFQKRQSGWSTIQTRLREEPVYVRSKVLIRAIADEEVALVKRLVHEKYSVINIEKYNFAVRNYKEKGTEKCEAIVDFIEKGNPELGAAIIHKDKLIAGWDQIKVHDYIFENNYPMLRRALDEGFDPNFVYAGSGSLLGLSVVAGCHRCVKMLVERNVNVNEPILLDQVVRVKGWNESAAIKGWTPLMFAVADGNVRIVKELIESGTALVSMTAIGQEESRFHARAAARKIQDVELKSDMFNLLVPSSTEYAEITNLARKSSFIDAMRNNDIATVDAHLLLSNNIKIPDSVDYSQFNLLDALSDMLRAELKICLK